jgi:hypothetical protein
VQLHKLAGSMQAKIPDQRLSVLITPLPPPATRGLCRRSPPTIVQHGINQRSCVGSGGGMS